MKVMSTFEEIFNQLSREYQGLQVEVETRHDNLKIASFTTRIKQITIEPARKGQGKNLKVGKKKLGLISIRTENNHNFNIPFLLGFNTMHAVFLTDGVTIKTLNMEFVLKKRCQRNSRGRKRRPA